MFSRRTVSQLCRNTRRCQTRRDAQPNLHTIKLHADSRFGFYQNRLLTSTTQKTSPLLLLPQQQQLCTATLSTTARPFSSQPDNTDSDFTDCDGPLANYVQKVEGGLLKVIYELMSVLNW